MNPIPPLAYLNSNNGTGLLAVGSGPSFTLETSEELPLLDAFLENHQGKYIFGYLSYALQEHIVGNKASNQSTLPLAFFWVPSEVAALDGTNSILHQGTRKDEISHYIRKIERAQSQALPEFTPAISRASYLERIVQIQQLIQRGDLYETNFCFEFFIENLVLSDPFSLYQRVNQRTKAPFSALLCLEDIWLACGSPERFLKKTGNQLISQPIKGTAPRHQDPMKDERLMEALKSSPKERSENVMIVDLVRNDLSKVALPNSVRVAELCGMYSFPNVHQMISTVTCKVSPNRPFSELLKATFPMGSMTGAPKRNSLIHMNALEPFSRELYSGSVGYFSPSGDFDFNVVIRSLTYTPATKRLSCAVGSAITAASDPAKEYEECLVKIARLIQ